MLCRAPLTATYMHVKRIAIQFPRLLTMDVVNPGIGLRMVSAASLSSLRSSEPENGLYLELFLLILCVYV